MMSENAPRRVPIMTKEQRQEFGKLLRDKRNAAGLTRLELAKLAKISDSTVKFIEAARHAVSRATLIRLIGVRELGLREEDIPRAEPITEFQAARKRAAEISREAGELLGPIFEIYEILSAAEDSLGDALDRLRQPGTSTLPTARAAQPRFKVRRNRRLVRARSWQRLCDLGELKLEVIDGRLTPSRKQQVALLGVLLEVVGADTVIAVTGPRIWREALADAADMADAGGS